MAHPPEHLHPSLDRRCIGAPSPHAVSCGPLRPTPADNDCERLKHSEAARVLSSRMAVA